MASDEMISLVSTAIKPVHNMTLAECYVDAGIDSQPIPT